MGKRLAFMIMVAAGGQCLIKMPLQPVPTIFVEMAGRNGPSAVY